MKKHIVVLAVLLQAASVSLFAQSKPKAGDIITGIVSDSDGPMMMVNVVERDSMNRIVAHCVTDIGGNFSFRLVDADHIVQVSYVGYEVVSVPIDTTFFEIKMKDEADLPQVAIMDGGTDDLIPLNDHPQNPTKEIMGLMDPNSWTFQYMQRNAPEGFVCGYVVNSPQANNIYSLFLIKDGKKYQLVKKIRDYQEIREINKKLAKKLEESIDERFIQAEERKKTETKQVSNINYNGIQSIRLYDGNYIYAMKPGIMGLLESGGSTELPDKVWNDEVGKFN